MLEDNSLPIIFDNGSSHCRVGWASSNAPDLNFKNVIAKNRGNRKEKDWDIQIGNQITDIEAVRWLLRTPFDFDVVVNYSIQETLFDYAFQQLNIDSDGLILHPIVLTEPICNPSFCRKNMSELMFEAYNVPKLSYGIDCLFSHYFNAPKNSSDSSLIISSGFQSTHVLPIVMGTVDVENSLRINLGGYNCTAYMQRLLQLRNPQFSSNLNLTKMEQVVHDLCYIPADYNDEIKKWEETSYQLKNTSSIFVSPKESAKANNFKPNAIAKESLQLLKQLRKLRHQLSEMECVVELEKENCDVAVKVAKDFGCDSLSKVREKIVCLYNVIENLKEKYDIQCQTDINKVNPLVKCGTEKIQVPEILFQPSLVGFEQCGIKECIETVMKRFPLQVQNDMAQNVFVTGGNSKIQGFKDRIYADLLELRPYDSKINVAQAADPILDGWKGAAQWSLTDHQCWITKRDFDEQGWDYFQKHRCSN